MVCVGGQLNQIAINNIANNRSVQSIFLAAHPIPSPLLLWSTTHLKLMSGQQLATDYTLPGHVLTSPSRPPSPGRMHANIIVIKGIRFENGDSSGAL